MLRLTIRGCWHGRAVRAPTDPPALTLLEWHTAFSSLPNGEIRLQSSCDFSGPVVIRFSAGGYSAPEPGIGPSRFDYRVSGSPAWGECQPYAAVCVHWSCLRVGAGGRFQPGGKEAPRLGRFKLRTPSYGTGPFHRFMVRVLPFGLATGPLVFTAAISHAVRFHGCMGNRFLPLFDDLIFATATAWESSTMGRTLRGILPDFGWLIFITPLRVAVGKGTRVKGKWAAFLGRESRPPARSFSRRDLLPS